MLKLLGLLLTLIVILSMVTNHFIDCKVARLGKKLNSRVVQLNTTRKLDQFKQPKVSNQIKVFDILTNTWMIT